MSITKRSLKKFNSIWERVYNEELSDDEVNEHVWYVLNNYIAIYGLPGRSNREKLSNDNEKQHDKEND